MFGLICFFFCTYLWIFDSAINLASERCFDTLLVMPVGGMRSIPGQCNVRLCCDIHFSDVHSWNLIWRLMQCPSRGLTACNTPYCAHWALHMLDWPKNETFCEVLSKNVFGWYTFWNNCLLEMARVMMRHDFFWPIYLKIHVFLQVLCG